MYIVNNELFTEDMAVINKAGNPVTGLLQEDFDIILYNPNNEQVANISGGIEVTLEEIGEGLYRVAFTPNEFGNWTLLIYNTTHFPFGKAGSYIAVESLRGVTQEIEDMIKRILGLSQENYRIFNPTYIIKAQQSCMTSATIKTYPTAIDVENDTNVIAEYKVTATFDNKAQMTNYKVKKV